MVTSYREGGPGFVRTSDTSKAAANSLKSQAVTIEDRLCKAIEVSMANSATPGLTEQEAKDATGMAPHQDASPRLATAALKGRIKDGGLRRPSRVSGRMQKVWFPAKGDLPANPYPGEVFGGTHNEKIADGSHG